MIKVSLIKNDERVIGLEVQGHANTAPRGEDLLCAAVSAILTGGFNSINDDDIIKVKLDEGYAYIEIKDDSEASIRLDTIICQLKTIEEVYPKNIKIK